MFFYCSFFSLTLGAILFLVVQCILLAGWISVYFKHKNCKSTPEELNYPKMEEPYRDFDPYFASPIFRLAGSRMDSSSVSPMSSPETSLDLVQKKLILTHFEDKRRKPR